MQKMKDSGVKWIGKIPETWLILHLKYVCDLKTGGTPANKIGIDVEGEIPWITAQDMIDASNITNYSQYITNETIKKNKYKLFPAGSTLLCCIASVGKNGFITKNAYSNQQITALMPKKNIFNRYLLYLINAGKDTIVFDASSNVVPIVNSQYLKGFSIMLPPLPEQEKISLFLDSKCAEIDELHIDIQKQIEILEEYKKAVITDAVTKGLNPDVEMKYSGIEWIGEIPKDWGISRLKYELETPMKYGASETGVDYSDDLPRYIRITDITRDNKLKDEGKLSLTFEQANGYMLEKDTILFARSGGTVGKTFLYTPDFGDAAFAGYLIAGTPDVNKMLAKWLYYYSLSNAYWDWVDRIFTQATIQNIGADKYSNMPITVPNTITQKKIIDYLDEKCNEFDSIIAEKKQQLEVLEQYKKSLIYEYVTGKKEVLE